MRRRWLVAASAAALLFVATGIYGAVDKDATKVSPPFRWAEKIDRDTDVKITALILKQSVTHSFRNDYAKIITLGIKAVPSLVRIGQDESVDFRKRWVAMIAAAEIFQPHRLKPEYDQWRGAFDEGIRVLLKDPFSMVRVAGVKAIAKCADPVFLPELHVLLRDPTIAVRDEVVRTLAMLKDKRSIAELERALYDEGNFIRGRGFFIRRIILQSLAVIGEGESTPALINVLKKKDSELVSESIRLLAIVNANESFKTAQDWVAWWEKKTSKRAQ